MVQKFLPLIKKGDKRVFIINGKVMGVFKRVPKKNYHAAGQQNHLCYRLNEFDEPFDRKYSSQAFN